MSKIFTWLFGAITGFVAGVLLIAWSMVVDPKGIIEIAEDCIDE